MESDFHAHAFFHRKKNDNNLLRRVLLFWGGRFLFFSTSLRGEAPLSSRQEPLLGAVPSFFGTGFFRGFFPPFSACAFFAGFLLPFSACSLVSGFAKILFFSDVILGVRYFSSVFFFPAVPCLLISGRSFG